MSKLETDKGFTLIELLVVIAIIGVLSSVLLSSLAVARAKARDAKTIATFRELKTALALYYDKYGEYPNLVNVTDGGDQWFGNFSDMAQDLVNEGFLSSVPQATNPNDTYDYYNFGPSGTGQNSPYNTPGSLHIMLRTSLETVPPSTTGINGSCRPFDNLFWCKSSQSTREYCVCM